MNADIQPVIGIIGGSGLYDIEGLERKRWRRVETPWGAPSDELLGMFHNFTYSSRNRGRVRECLWTVNERDENGHNAHPPKSKKSRRHAKNVQQSIATRVFLAYHRQYGSDPEMPVKSGLR